MTLNAQLVIKYIRKMRRYGRRVDVHLAVIIARRFIARNVTMEYASQVVDSYAAACWNNGAIS